MIPIMKLELWETIRNEAQLFKNEPPTNVTKNSAILEEQGTSKRYVIRCEGEEINFVFLDSIILIFILQYY